MFGIFNKLKTDKYISQMMLFKNIQKGMENISQGINCLIEICKDIYKTWQMEERAYWIKRYCQTWKKLQQIQLNRPFYFWTRIDSKTTFKYSDLTLWSTVS